MSDWKPPEVKLMGFWDRLGWKLRKRRLGRAAQHDADRARDVLADQARKAGIPVRNNQIH